jgi:hypothetical protein
MSYSPSERGLSGFGEYEEAATESLGGRRLGNPPCLPSIDQPHQQDYYEDDDQDTEYQLYIPVVPSSRSPRPHLLAFLISEPCRKLRALPAVVAEVPLEGSKLRIFLP